MHKFCIATFYSILAFLNKATGLYSPEFNYSQAFNYKQVINYIYNHQLLWKMEFRYDIKAYCKLRFNLTENQALLLSSPSRIFNRPFGYDPSRN